MPCSSYFHSYICIVTALLSLVSALLQSYLLLRRVLIVIPRDKKEEEWQTRLVNNAWQWHLITCIRWATTPFFVLHRHYSLDWMVYGRNISLEGNRTNRCTCFDRLFGHKQVQFIKGCHTRKLETARAQYCLIIHIYWKQQSQLDF